MLPGNLCFLKISLVCLFVSFFKSFKNFRCRQMPINSGYFHPNYDLIGTNYDLIGKNYDLIGMKL